MLLGLARDASDSASIDHTVTVSDLEVDRANHCQVAYAYLLARGLQEWIRWVQERRPRGRFLAYSSTCSCSLSKDLGTVALFRIYACGACIGACPVGCILLKGLLFCGGFVDMNVQFATNVAI